MLQGRQTDGPLGTVVGEEGVIHSQGWDCPAKHKRRVQSAFQTSKGQGFRISISHAIFGIYLSKNFSPCLSKRQIPPGVLWFH